MKRIVDRNSLIAVTFLMVSVCFGCGPRFVQTEYVEGVVTLDGKPVGHASISFTLIEENGKLFASGETDESGIYRLTMYPGGADGKGTISGEYAVAIRKQESRLLPSNNPNYSEEIIHVVDIVPKKYHRISTSGLTASIVKGNNKIDFQLVSK